MWGYAAARGGCGGAAPPSSQRVELAPEDMETQISGLCFTGGSRAGGGGGGGGGGERRPRPLGPPPSTRLFVGLQTGVAELAIDSVARRSHGFGGGIR